MSIAGLELDIASRLRAAYHNGQIQPFSAEVENSIESAYRIQDQNTDHALNKDGRTIVGRKIGLTSLAVQKQLGVDQPDYGVLFADMAIDDGRNTTVTGLLQPKIEAEIAFGFKRDMNDSKVDLADLIASIEWVAPALEIVDSRIADWRIGIVETIADNASSGRFVVGGRTPFSSTIDVIGCEMTLHEGAELVSSGNGAACMGSPLSATLWLVRKMAEVGRPVRAGELVLSGALGPMVKLRSGQQYQAVVDGLGGVSVSFGCDC
ncbi:4-oxalocrotonate decarboxylase [Caballeronia arvi]|uniref:4-oxalocrotonate decarboxylase n=1 Tax=Caballeronia arvi TaxID=1777135 RepID=A0A158KJ60_9BURK|nr:fumarylacetoacetate hydrolase family protein [Caballeronia arvi]SAL80799.1 4-oxalocrotonate decarboxylase [Caballeronia arvi]